MAGRRRPLAVEAAARKDLRAFPSAYRDSAVGKTYLLLARRLDAGLSARDAATLAREMRLTLLALYDLAPPHREDDPMDELRERRERRMQQLAASAEEDA